MKYNQKKTSKKTKIIIIIVLLCIFGLYTVVVYNKIWPLSGSKNLDIKSTSANTTSGEISYDPPTEEEVKEGQEAKKRIIESSEEDEDVSENIKTTVSVGVAFADVVDGKLEIRAFIPNVIEGDGICTATLKKDENIIQESSSAFIDFKTSQCRPIYISVDRFKIKGSWSLTVSYKSDTSNGESEPTEINI